MKWFLWATCIFLAIIPKITQLDHSSFSKENVLWFHVPMKNPVRVQIVQGFDKLAGNHSDLKIPNIRNSHVNSGMWKTITLHVTKYMSTKQHCGSISCSMASERLNGTQLLYMYV